MDHSEIKHLPKVDHAPAELDEPSKVMLKAATLIEQRGLAKHIQCDERGGLCIYGALIVADGGIPWTHGLGPDEVESIGIFAGKTPNALEAVRRIEANLCIHDAAIWNNASERTAVEVIAKLRAVALTGSSS